MKGRNFLGIRGKMILAIMVVGAIPVVLGLAVSYIRGTAQLREVIGGSFEALALESALNLDGDIQRLIDSDQILAYQATQDPELLSAMKKSASSQGRTRFDWPVPVNKKLVSDILLDSWVTDQRGLKGGTGGTAGSHGVLVDLLRTDGEDGRFILHFSIPISYTPGGKILGWLQRRYDLEKFLADRIESIRFGDTGHVMIIDHRGRIVDCPLLPSGTLISNRDLVNDVSRDKAGWINATSDGHGDATASLIGHAPLKILNRQLMDRRESLYTFVWQDTEEIFAPMRSLQTGVAISGVCALLLLGGLGFYASNRIVDPIRRLSREAGHIAEGDLNRTIDIRTGDEIEELGDQFNNMTTQLRHFVENLEAKVEERTRELRATHAEKDQVVQHLIQAEKAAAIGTMTSGIGHEINNPLYAILGRAEAIESGASEDQFREYGGEIVGFCKHIGEIVKNLAGYVRPDGDSETELVDVNEKISEAASMVNMALLNDHVEIRKQCNAVPRIQARSKEIHQVFFNIIRNAAQAIEDRGTVEIESRLEGDQVKIRIKDNGSGISKENLGKIFDPFFTTKGPDKGEGLGLYIVKQTILKNGGTLNVESKEGVGTAFNLNFPVGETTKKEEAHAEKSLSGG